MASSHSNKGCEKISVRKHNFKKTHFLGNHGGYNCFDMLNYRLPAGTTYTDTTHY